MQWLGMLLVCMGKARFGGIIWGEVVMIYAQKFPISMSTFQKGVHCTKALHPLTCAVRGALQHPQWSTDVVSYAVGGVQQQEQRGHTMTEIGALLPFCLGNFGT